MDGARGWGFVFVDGSDEQLPDRWRERARRVTVVPLLTEEAERLIGGEVTTPTLIGQELQIARLAARGVTVREIARRLEISQRSAERGIASLRKRFGAESKQALTSLLASRGFDR